MTGSRGSRGRTGRQSGRQTARGRFRADDRSVSVTLNYALNLAVATLLVAGVLTATGGMVENRRESAVRTELSVLGERVAADLMAADRLAEAATAGPGDNTTVAATVSLPNRVAGTHYEVSVETSPARIVLVSDDPEVEVTVPYRHDTEVAETTVEGGDLRIELKTDPDQLEVFRA